MTSWAVNFEQAQVAHHDQAKASSSELEGPSPPSCANTPPYCPEKLGQIEASQVPAPCPSVRLLCTSTTTY
jgi:hypothetical protein